MSRTPSVSPNPKLLAWARQEGGFELSFAAKRLQVKPERLAAWEVGELIPTVRQTGQLAHLYQRPLSLFFQSKPPLIEPLAAQYRRLPGIKPGEESPELRLSVRQMLDQRETAINLMEELGDELTQFRLVAHKTEKPEVLGSRLRDIIGISITEQLGWHDYYQAWRSWRSAIERQGVLVFMFHRVEAGEVRGIALYQDILPVIGVNTKEIVESRPYTAIHELIHLMLTTAREESSALRDQHSSSEWRQLERFVEAVASHTLVPESELTKVIAANGSRAMDIAGIRAFARRFKISPLAMATRLRESDYLSWGQYRAWRREWNKYVSQLPKSGGFSTPYDKALGRVGQTYALLVLEALDANRITAADSSRYLGLRFHQFGELRKRLMVGAQGVTSDA